MHVFVLMLVDVIVVVVWLVQVVVIVMLVVLVGGMDVCMVDGLLVVMLGIGNIGRNVIMLVFVVV
jgi:hypothetical protein